MKNNSEAIELLMVAQRRFLVFKGIFNRFQQEILRLGTDNYPVKGIAVEIQSDTVSKLAFVGREYEIDFSVTVVEGALKGKVSFYGVSGEEEKVEISSTTYNGQGQADIEPPNGEDPIILNDDVSSTLLVLNWLCNDVNT